PFCPQLLGELQRDRERDVLLLRAVLADRARVVTAVAGVDDHALHLEPQLLGQRELLALLIFARLLERRHLALADAHVAQALLNLFDRRQVQPLGRLAVGHVVRRRGGRLGLGLRGLRPRRSRAPPRRLGHLDLLERLGDAAQLSLRARARRLVVVGVIDELLARDRLRARGRLALRGRLLALARVVLRDRLLCALGLGLLADLGLLRLALELLRLLQQLLRRLGVLLVAREREQLFIGLRGQRQRLGRLGA